MVSGALGAVGICPGSDFEKFLAAFSDDVAIQRRYTALPLIHELIDANTWLRYRFRRNGNCWHLIRTSDDYLGR